MLYKKFNQRLTFRVYLSSSYSGRDSPLDSLVSPSEFCTVWDKNRVSTRLVYKQAQYPRQHLSNCRSLFPTLFTQSLTLLPSHSLLPLSLPSPSLLPFLHPLFPFLNHYSPSLSPCSLSPSPLPLSLPSPSPSFFPFLSFPLSPHSPSSPPPPTSVSDS